MKTLKNQLVSNVSTKQVQNKISRYFIKLENHLSKPESRRVREMTIGILKSGTILVNKVATGICDNIHLSQATKWFRNHYINITKTLQNIKDAVTGSTVVISLAPKITLEKMAAVFINKKNGKNDSQRHLVY